MVAAVSVGVFPGAAVRDSLLAVVVYGPEDYSRLFGDGPDGYQDYLIRQEEFVRAAYRGRYGVVRVVRVPFVREEFEAWARRHPGLGDCPNAHAAWALEVASDPGRLSALERRVGVLPRPALEQGYVADVWCLAVAVPGLEVWGLEASLPLGAVDGACRVLRGLCRAAPPLERLSAVRARGLGFAGGLALVDPERSGALASVLEACLVSGWEAGSVPSALHVPRRFRPRSCGPGWRVVAWPFGVLGAASEVTYAAGVLSAGSSYSALNLAACGVMSAAGADLGSGWPVLCLPLEELKEAVPELVEAAEDLPEAELRAVGAGV